MSGPEIPEREWLRLPEAVALVSPPLDTNEVIDALERALGDGRLLERPQSIISGQEAQQRVDAVWTNIQEAVHRDAGLGFDHDHDADHVYLARAIKAFSTVASPGRFQPSKWHRWAADGAIDWTAGEIVLIHDAIGLDEDTIYRPELRRADVLALFSLDQRSRSQKLPGKFSASALAEWYEKRVATWPPDEKHPSAKDDVDAAQAELGPGVNRDAVRDVRNRKAPAAWRSFGRRPRVNSPK